MEQENETKVLQITIYKDWNVGWNVVCVNPEAPVNKQFSLYTYDTYEEAMNKFKELAKEI